MNRVAAPSQLQLRTSSPVFPRAAHAASPTRLQVALFFVGRARSLGLFNRELHLVVLSAAFVHMALAPLPEALLRALPYRTLLNAPLHRQAASPDDRAAASSSLLSSSLLSSSFLSSNLPLSSSSSSSSSGAALPKRPGGHASLAECFGRALGLCPCGTLERQKGDEELL